MLLSILVSITDYTRFDRSRQLGSYMTKHSLWPPIAIPLYSAKKPWGTPFTKTEKLVMEMQTPNPLNPFLTEAHFSHHLQKKAPIYMVIRFFYV